jgi:hypothetical protein
VSLLKLGTANKVKIALIAEFNRISSMSNKTASAQEYLDNVLQIEINRLDSYLIRKRERAKKVIRCDPRNLALAALHTTHTISQTTPPTRSHIQLRFNKQTFQENYVRHMWCSPRILHPSYLPSLPWIHSVITFAELNRTQIRFQIRLKN